MEYILQREHMSKHCQNPGNRVQLRDEADAVQVVEQDRVVECLDVAELSQVLLNDGRVVSPKHAVQVLRNECGETRERQCLVVEVQIEEGSTQGIQTLPINVLVQIGLHPCFKDSLELSVSLRRCEKVVVLVASRNIDLDLSVRRSPGLLINGLVGCSHVMLNSKQRRPDVS